MSWLFSRRLTAGLVLLAAASLAGCGRSTATVTGKVSYQGAPLKGGNITFHHAGAKQSRMASIGEDGRYTIDQMPAGDVTITVETESLRRKASLPKYAPPPGTSSGSFTAANRDSDAQRYVQIPGQYANPETSGLTVKLKGGKQQHDIPLP